MNNNSRINTSKGKIYLTVVAMASLLVMAFGVNTNSMNVNAIDFGLISKDTNIGSIDTNSLFNCVGAAITCDNDNTVNNNIAINNGTNGGNGGGDDPLTCEECFEENLTPAQMQSLELALDATRAEICEILMMGDPSRLAQVEDTLLIIGVDADSVADSGSMLGSSLGVIGQKNQNK